MSGLDSIAMAVAHLEEISSQKKAPGNVQETAKDQAAPVSKPPGKVSIAMKRSSPSPDSIMTSRPALVLPKQTSRVVSSESIVPPPPEASGTDSKSSATVSNAASPETEKTSLAMVLANPGLWLDQVQHQTIPDAPKGSFERVEDLDVLCGRGGESNHHPGNQMYRKLVKAFQPLYISSKRRHKPRIAQCIVFTIRSYGGKFLKRTDPRGSKFEDVGNTKAREKTSQALREGAPEIRGNVNASDESEDVPATSNVNYNQQGPTTSGTTTSVAAMQQPHHHLTPMQRAQLGPLAPNPMNYMHLSAFAALTPMRQAQLSSLHHGVYQYPHLTPLQQALLMRSNASNAAMNPSTAQSHVSAPAGPTNNVLVAGHKRPLTAVVSEESSSEGSMPLLPNTGKEPSRGPRLKRLKHRVSKAE